MYEPLRRDTHRLTIDSRHEDRPAMIVNTEPETNLDESLNYEHPGGRVTNYTARA